MHTFILKTEADTKSLQKDLEELVEWSDEWQLRFNPIKCKLMHINQPLQCGLVIKYRMSYGSTKVEVKV